jgi:hypothetical protein
MPQHIDVPGMGIVEFPDGMSDSQISSAIQANMPKQPSFADGVIDSVKNIGMGALNGATDIGKTLLSPIDWAAKKVNNGQPINIPTPIDGLTIPVGIDRSPVLDQFYKEKADPTSLSFQGARLGIQVAGTAGAGGIVANGLKAVPRIAAAAPSLINSIESGGFSLGKPAATTIAGKVGDLATRMAGGGVLGGVSSGLIDPKSSGTGATIGAALPPALKVGAAAGSALNDLGGWAVKNTLGITTGVGDEAIKNAIQSGTKGDTAFLENMRGNVPMGDVVQQAKDALTKMRIARSEAYQNGMKQVSNDKTVLDVQPILDAANNVQAMGAYKGQLNWLRIGLH